MKSLQYHKLVRDRILKIIEKAGKRCTTAILSNDEYLTMLDERLNKELLEYQESKSLEELTDLLEVMRTLAAARGSSFEKVESIRQDKAEKCGSFTKRILLLEV